MSRFSNHRDEVINKLSTKTIDFYSISFKLITILLVSW